MEESDVGIICVIIYDDLALEAWTQSTERETERVKMSEPTEREYSDFMLCFMA